MSTIAEPARVTRLAPSPTGALHLGNARTFLINWAMARRSEWRVVLRIEDFDTPRVKPETVHGVPQTLQWLGLDWDEGPIVQSERLEPHVAALEQLRSLGVAYLCVLSRTQIEAAASASAPQQGTHEVRYGPELRPESFTLGTPWSEPDTNANWRFAVDAGPVSFIDAFAGEQRVDVAATIGDFLVWTKRGVPAYQLAVVIDDHAQGVTDVVRGDDLVESAARQLLLYRALNLTPEPRYWHLPLVTGTDGLRLAKRHGDTRVDHYRSHGVPAEAIIGLVGRWCGLLDKRETLDLRSFTAGLNLDKIPRTPIQLTQEDDAWLLSTAH